MESDERAFREALKDWIEAVNAGNLARLLTLMTDDVVFLNPGREPFGRDGFPGGFSAPLAILDSLQKRFGRGRGSRRSCLHAVPRLVISESAFGRRGNGVGRSSDHHIPQTDGRLLASGPRRAHTFSGGELNGLLPQSGHPGKSLMGREGCNLVAIGKIPVCPVREP